MTKEIFVDRSGNRINKESLEDYDLVGFRYNEEQDVVIWEYTARSPAPVLGAAIIGCFIILLIAVIIWIVISLI